MYDIATATTLYIDPQNGTVQNCLPFVPKNQGNGLAPIKNFTGDGGRNHTVPRFDLVSVIYALRRAGNSLPLTVKLVGKRIFLDKTVTLPADIGHVTFEPESETCEITGGYRLQNIYETTFNGVRCFAAKLPAAYHGVELYVDGTMADDTRYPETGYLSPDPETVEVKDYRLDQGSRYFSAREGDLDALTDIESMQLHYYHRWVDGHTPIASFDQETRRVTLARRTRFTIYYPDSGDDRYGARMKYWLTNVPTAFKKPNQWYLDKAEHTVYYIPRSAAQTPENVEMILPVTQILFDVQGDGIGFKNIDFTYTTSDYASPAIHTHTGELMSDEYYTTDPQSVCYAPGAVCFNSCADGFVESCTFSHTGLHGILLGKGTKSCRITGNTLTHLGAGGIRIVGSQKEHDEAGSSYGHTVTDNVLSCGGERHWAGCGILIMHAHHITVAHNDISHFQYSGISAGWVWGYAPSNTHHLLIEKNLIHHIGMGHLSDMGGIYLLGMQPGTLVRGNVIHGVKSEAYGGNGLYTDEGSSYITLENNLVYDCQVSVHQHFGRQNIFRNNILLQKGGFVVNATWNEMHIEAVFEHNLIYMDNAALHKTGGWGFPLQRVVSRDNLIFDAARATPVTLARDDGTPVCTGIEELRTAYGMELGSLVADPHFADITGGDFTLRENSPAEEIGFRPFHYADAGVRRN